MVIVLDIDPCIQPHTSLEEPVHYCMILHSPLWERAPKRPMAHMTRPGRPARARPCTVSSIESTCTSPVFSRPQPTYAWGRDEFVHAYRISHADMICRAAQQCKGVGLATNFHGRPSPCALSLPGVLRPPSASLLLGGSGRLYRLVCEQRVFPWRRWL